MYEAEAVSDNSSRTRDLGRSALGLDGGRAIVVADYRRGTARQVVDGSVEALQDRADGECAGGRWTALADVSGTSEGDKNRWPYQRRGPGSSWRRRPHRRPRPNWIGLRWPARGGLLAGEAGGLDDGVNVRSGAGGAGRK